MIHRYRFMKKDILRAFLRYLVASCHLNHCLHIGNVADLVSILSYSHKGETHLIKVWHRVSASDGRRL